MSIPELSADIAVARAEFIALNREHWYRSRGSQFKAYRKLTSAKETRVVALAEHITRLERFTSCMAAKELLERDFV